jgi:hypothetical protein
MKKISALLVFVVMAAAWPSTGHAAGEFTDRDTGITVSGGNWMDPNTWSLGRVPQNPSDWTQLFYSTPSLPVVINAGNMGDTYGLMLSCNDTGPGVPGGALMVYGTLNAQRLVYGNWVANTTTADSLLYIGDSGVVNVTYRFYTTDLWTVASKQNIHIDGGALNVLGTADIRNDRNTFMDFTLTRDGVLRVEDQFLLVNSGNFRVDIASSDALLIAKPVEFDKLVAGNMIYANGSLATTADFQTAPVAGNANLTAYSLVVIPEPASVTLLGLGAVVALLCKRR